MKERIFRRTKNSFVRISENIRARIGIEIEPEIVKAEMRRIRRYVQERINSGEWDISSVPSSVFKGIFPLIVFAGAVYVAKKICTSHEAVFEDNPDIPKSESPIGGFIWPFSTESGGVYEPDEELIEDKFPAEQLIEDRQALSEFLEEEDLVQIKKAEYLK